MRASRQTLEAAGPAFIKWGQWAATRHDLFPPDLCAELEHLHTQVAFAQDFFFGMCIQDFSTQDVKFQAYKLCCCRNRSHLRRADHPPRPNVVLVLCPSIGFAIWCWCPAGEHQDSS